MACRLLPEAADEELIQPSKLALRRAAPAAAGSGTSTDGRDIAACQNRHQSLTIEKSNISKAQEVALRCAAMTKTSAASTGRFANNCGRHACNDDAYVHLSNLAQIGPL